MVIDSDIQSVPVITINTDALVENFNLFSAELNDDALLKQIHIRIHHDISLLVVAEDVVAQ